MKEIRCIYCNKLIVKAEGKAILECKCSRCSKVFVTEINTQA